MYVPCGGWKKKRVCEFRDIISGRVSVLLSIHTSIHAHNQNKLLIQYILITQKAPNNSLLFYVPA